MEWFTSVLEKVDRSKSAAELAVILNEVNERFNLVASVFTSFTREDETFDSYRHVIACPSAWCNQYTAKRWFAIDPCLIYAQQNSEPALVDSIPVRTQGQKALMAAAREFGFESGAVFPAHSAGGRIRMGVLYVAAGDRGSIDVETLQKCKHVFRSLATEMLEWWLRKTREELVSKVRLTDVEMQLLRYELEGYSTKAIALKTGMTPNSIDARFRRIALRFGENSRRVVAERAYEVGILSDL